MAIAEPWTVVEAGGKRAVAAQCAVAGKEPGFVIAEMSSGSRRHARLISAAPDMEQALRLSLPALEAAGATGALRAVRKALRVVDGRARAARWRLGEELLLRSQADAARRVGQAIEAFAAAEEARFRARLVRERMAWRSRGKGRAAYGGPACGAPRWPTEPPTAAAVRAPVRPTVASVGPASPAVGFAGSVRAGRLPTDVVLL